MKVLSVFLFACCCALWAQTTPAPAAAPQMPDIPEQTVIAVFDDGVKLTMGDFKKIFAVLPADNQPLVLRNRKSFLQQWAFMRKLAQMAEKQKLDLEPPTKEQLEYSRLMILSQAKLSEAMYSTTVEPAAAAPKLPPIRSEMPPPRPECSSTRKISATADTASNATNDQVNITTSD